MEHTVTECRDIEIDLESGRVVESSVNEGSVYINMVSPSEAEDPLLLMPQRVGSCKPVGNAEKKDGSKEKRKKSSNKKPPRPPRAPRRPSLDAADQKLMREIAELAMLKRARLERMKALKKAKNCKTSFSSSNTILALVFTIIFFLVILYQAMCPTTQSTLVGFEGPSPESAGGLISVQYYPSSSANFVDPPSDSSHELIQKVAGIDTPQQNAVTASG